MQVVVAACQLHCVGAHQRGKEGGGDEQSSGAVRPAAQQHALVHQRAEPEERVGGAECGAGAVEFDRVLSHQQHQYRIAFRRHGRSDGLRHVSATQVHEPVPDEVETEIAGIPPDRGHRRSRPDIVVADDEPAPHPGVLPQPAQRRRDLAVRRLAAAIDVAATLAAFVEGGVHIRHPARDHRSERIAYGGDVPSADCLDRARCDELIDASGDQLRVGPAVDHFDLHFAAENSAIDVEVVGRQLADGFTCWPENAARTLQGYHHGHPPCLADSAGGLRVHDHYVLCRTVRGPAIIIFN